MGDFLRGTIGRLLQIVFVLLGLVLVFGGLFGGSGLAVVFGVVCWCAAFGIRYWLGHIIRQR